MAQQTADRDTRGQSETLTDSPMMQHLLDALDRGEDIGHYGRLTFVMIAQWFLDKEDLVRKLSGQPGGEEDARRLVAEVEAHGYNPPKRDKILAWQQDQDFPICPDAEDPSACNIYSELRFPDEVYENIGEFWEEKVEANQD